MPDSKGCKKVTEPSVTECMETLRETEGLATKLRMLATFLMRQMPQKVKRKDRLASFRYPLGLKIKYKDL